MSHPHPSVPAVRPVAPPESRSRTREIRNLTPLDRLVSGIDQGLRTLGGTPAASRPNPAGQLPDTVAAEDRQRVARYMRINHSGEVAAQALYAGQALTARNAETHASMTVAAQEESDHLAWCEARIAELGGRKSLLNPLWYAGSFCVGAAAGLAGDRTSLGFVAETEKQVVNHLDEHLRELPADARTRAILEQMSADEARHGASATLAGGIALPGPIRMLMRLTAMIMTKTAYWL